jgi:hypothetical protein
MEGIIPEVPTVEFRFPPAPLNSDEAVVKILLKNSSILIDGHWKMYTAPPPGWRTYVTKRVSSSFNSNIHPFDENCKDNLDVVSHIWTHKLMQKASDQEETDSLERQHSKSDATVKKTTMSPGGLLPGSGPKRNSRCSILNSQESAKLFNISVTNGSLSKDETQVLTFQYKFETPGEHKYCVLLRVYPCIFVWIDLIGKTLESYQPNLELMHGQFIDLHPVSVSDLDPPLQVCAQTF